MAEPIKRLKSGLESVVGDLVDLDEGPPPTQKPPAPISSVVINQPQAPKPATKPAHGGKGGGLYRGPVIPKGSQIAPKRESSADYIDGRSARAKGRNSRLNLSLSPRHLNAFKWWARLYGREYNDAFEAWVEEKCTQQFNDLAPDGGEE